MYEKYLKEDPPYVPRKFRNDRYDAKTDEERFLKRTMDLEQFRGICEIYKLRRNNLLNEINDVDEEAAMFITSKGLETEVEGTAIDRWLACVQEDVNRINKKWQSKATSTEAAHLKDKEQFTKQTQTKKVTHKPTEDEPTVIPTVIPTVNLQKNEPTVVLHHRVRYPTPTAAETALSSTNSTPKEPTPSNPDHQNPAQTPPSAPQSDQENNNMTKQNENNNTAEQNKTNDMTKLNKNNNITELNENNNMTNQNENNITTKQNIIFHEEMRNFMHNLSKSTNMQPEIDNKPANKVTTATIHPRKPSISRKKAKSTSALDNPVNISVNVEELGDPFEISPATPKQAKPQKKSKNLTHQTSPNRRKESLRSSTYLKQI